MNNKLEQLLSKTGDIALRRRAAWLVDHLDFQNGDKILDIGCGDGFYLYLLSHLNSTLELYGLDLDKNALKSARVHLKNKNISLIQGSILNLPFKNGTFDGIVISEVLEHVTEENLALKEVNRVLKKGGKVVISVPHANYPFLWDPLNWILERVFNTHITSGFWAGIWNQHIRLYQDGALLKLLKRNNFQKVEITTLTHYCLPFNHYIINLGARILASKKISNNAEQSLSKFSGTSNRHNFLYQIFFGVDRFNDFWNGKGAALSLVAFARK